MSNRPNFSFTLHADRHDIDIKVDHSAPESLWYTIHLGDDVLVYLNAEQLAKLVSDASAALQDADIVTAEKATADAVDKAEAVIDEIIEIHGKDVAAAIAERDVARRLLRCDDGGPAKEADHAPDSSPSISNEQWITDNYLIELEEANTQRDDDLEKNAFACGVTFDETFALNLSDQKTWPPESRTKAQNDEAELVEHRGYTEAVVEAAELAEQNRLNAEASEESQADEGTVPGLNSEL